MTQEWWTGRTEFEVETSDEAADPMTISGGPMTEEPEYSPSIDEDLPTEEPGVDMGPRGEVRGRETEENVEETDAGPAAKRARHELVELYMTAVEKAMANKWKKEIQFSKLEEERRGPFMRAIDKEIRNNLKTGAYELVSAEESERIRRDESEKIVKSRYVLTEKSIEDEDADGARTEGVLLRGEEGHATKAKARHVMQGFSEHGAEELETTTPQCGRDTVICVLQLLCSSGWIPGYLDFTQAFHSGDSIRRVIYASQPTDYPIPGATPRQLLKLLKTCYGLLDGPYAWYRHLFKVMTEILHYKVRRTVPSAELWGLLRMTCYTEVERLIGKRCDG